LRHELWGVKPAVRPGSLPPQPARVGISVRRCESC
jgi:hypothetical protein